MLSIWTFVLIIGTLSHLTQGYGYIPQYIRQQADSSEESSYNPWTYTSYPRIQMQYRPFNFGNLHGYISKYQYSQEEPYSKADRESVDKLRTKLPTTQLAQIQARSKQARVQLARLINLEKKLQTVVRRQYDDALVQVLYRILESSRGSKPVVPRQHLDQLRMSLLSFLFPNNQFGKDMIVNATSSLANQTEASTVAPVTVSLPAVTETTVYL